MNPDRFVQRTVGPAERYSYEGVFHVWDIYIVSGCPKYATDGHLVETPGPQHMAIIEHFRLAEGDDALSQAAGHYTPDAPESSNASQGMA